MASFPCDAWVRPDFVERRCCLACQQHMHNFLKDSAVFVFFDGLRAKEEVKGIKAIGHNYVRPGKGGGAEKGHGAVNCGKFPVKDGVMGGGLGRELEC